MKFGTVMHLGPPQPISGYNLPNLKIQNGNRLTDFDKIWCGNASGPYAPVWVLKMYDCENPISQMLT